MHFVLQRYPSTDDATIGDVFLNGIFFCNTIEDVVREVEGEPVESWKVPGKTAIPAGTYKVVLENSNRFGPDTITLLDVPGFKYIRGHAGNTSEDTEGCLLFGITSGEEYIKNSRVTVEKVKQVVRAAINGGDEVTIEIKNA